MPPVTKPLPDGFGRLQGECRAPPAPGLPGLPGLPGCAGQTTLDTVKLCGFERYDIFFRQRRCVQALENSVEVANRYRRWRRDLDADRFS